MSTSKEEIERLNEYMETSFDVDLAIIDEAEGRRMPLNDMRDLVDRCIRLDDRGELITSQPGIKYKL